MGASPLHINLDLEPTTRFESIDVAHVISDRYGDVLDGFSHALYCSHHTTAGYLDPSITRRLTDRRDGTTPFVNSFRRMFPQNAGYRHDDMALRSELSEEQRRTEPPNADAHLTFIGAGLQNCVTYQHRPGKPVYFVELDGVYAGQHRHRTTTVVAYDTSELVADEVVAVPVTRHAIDSVNLADPRLGLLQQAQDLIKRHGLAHGRVDITLASDERSSAVTVNEFETLLMRHDLTEVLKDPLRFMLRQGRRVLQDPKTVPIKSLGYARYDVVQIMNLLMDALGLSESSVERLIARLMGFPAQRMLRFKRNASLPVTTDVGSGPHLVRGRYQSPILIQWQPTKTGYRKLRLRLTRFT